MSVDPAWEQPRAGGAVADGFSDAVTFSFGDPGASVYGVARVGLSADPGDPAGPAVASGLALLFVDGAPVAVRADGGVAVARPTWDAIDAAGVRTTIEAPLEAWTVSFTGEEPGTGFALRFAALAEPALLDADDPVAKAGGMSGYESACRVTGVVTVGGQERPIDGRGQRGHSWGAPDWERLSMARTIGVWLDDDLAVSVTAVRERRARSHADEAVAAFLFERPEEGPGAVAPHAVAEPFVSTTYDGEGRQRAAGLELYVTEDGHARRVAGEAVCGTTLDLGRLRLDCAFFRWRMEGREGFGRYDVLRRV